MAVSMSWLVVSDEALGSVKSVLKVTDEYRRKQPSLVGHRSKTGQIFLFDTRGRGGMLKKNKIRAALSADHQVYFFQYDTRALFSEAALWQKGQAVWSVSHTYEAEVFDLKTSGTLPPSFERYKTKRWREQIAAGGLEADVDYMSEVAMDLSKELTGYHPKQGDEEEESIVLYSATRSLFSWIFGAK